MDTIVNTTFYVHPSLESAFLGWLSEVYMPAALEAGMKMPSLARLRMSDLDPEADVDGFAFQLRAQDDAVASRWHNGRGSELLKEFVTPYGTRIVHFTSWMEDMGLK